MECALCRQERPLMKSHIVPEFAHKPMYDHKHRAVRLGYGEAPRSIQKGLRERLLCEDCEEVIQTSESYFAKYWYGTRPVPEKLDGDELLLTDIDYGQFKLFLLSVVWRASVSRRPEFAGAELGRHEGVMRKMLLAKSPGPADQYPIYAGLIVEPHTREPWDRVMLAPLKIRVRSNWASRMVFGAVAWTVLTSSHQTLGLESHFLTEAGELRLAIFPWRDFVRASGLLEAVQGSRHDGVGQRQQRLGDLQANGDNASE